MNSNTGGKQLQRPWGEEREDVQLAARGKAKHRRKNKANWIRTGKQQKMRSRE
jgi:hypothetical protein